MRMESVIGFSSFEWGWFVRYSADSIPVAQNYQDGLFGDCGNHRLRQSPIAAITDCGFNILFGLGVQSACRRPFSFKENSMNQNRSTLLDLYADLRVADVRDGMDWLGMHAFGSMSPDIRPLWRTRAVGIARTARYLPFVGPLPKLTPEEYTAWQGWYYNTVCTYPWMNDLESGDFVVIDVSGVDVGLCGSNNTLDALQKGVRGFVTNGGGVRDSDEVILQKIPFWSKFISQGMVQSRLQYDAHNIPVAVGGVTVCPGDVVVADGDGVIVVPRGLAVDVATYAHQELRNDKAARRAKYEALGRDLDATVR
jgi:regulator of RNase E activity RraA